MHYYARIGVAVVERVPPDPARKSESRSKTNRGRAPAFWKNGTKCLPRIADVGPSTASIQPFGPRFVSRVCHRPKV